jgi:2-polyprenyl-3-methyl-5-hydroxy-6-metoxy-1,4-benzoquinol methylase
MARLTDMAKRMLGRSERPVANQDSESGPPVPLVDAMLSGWFNNDTDELFTGFAISADDVVADIGCGDGSNLAFAARRGATVVAVDIDADAIAGARTILADYPTAQFHVAGAEQIPLGDGQATRIVCTEVLEHVDDPAVVIDELVRIGAPGALYLVTVPDPLHEEMQSHVAPDSYFEKPNHIRRIERNELVDMLSAGGLDILDTHTYGFYWSIWWALFWAADVDLGESHPLLDGWSQVWGSLLDSERGRNLKAQLDEFLPMSQLVIARKPDSD